MDETNALSFALAEGEYTYMCETAAKVTDLLLKLILQLKIK